MTPERLSYLMQENLLRGECSATRDELHWIFTQLTSMTKRAEDAEVWGQDTVCRRTNEKEAAEAKLATAAVGLRDIWNLKFTEADPADRMFGIARALARGTLRALGIDPSKETL